MQTCQTTSYITKQTTAIRDETFGFGQICGFCHRCVHALMPRIGCISVRHEGADAMEDDVMGLESRVARIEGELDQLKSRLAGAEVDLRDLRQSVDQKLDKLDDKLESRSERLVAKIDRLRGELEAGFEKLDAKIA